MWCRIIPLGKFLLLEIAALLVGARLFLRAPTIAIIKLAAPAQWLGFEVAAFGWAFVMRNSLLAVGGVGLAPEGSRTRSQKD
jgi:hypothetical protein